MRNKKKQTNTNQPTVKHNLHLIASSSSFVTPIPLRNDSPRAYWAEDKPCSAANLNHMTPVVSLSRCGLPEDRRSRFHPTTFVLPHDPQLLVFVTYPRPMVAFQESDLRFPFLFHNQWTLAMGRVTKSLLTYFNQSYLFISRQAILMVHSLSSMLTF